MNHRFVFLWLLSACAFSAGGAGKDWPVYLGDSASSHYSELKQITKKNVASLEVAWVYRAGDGRADNRSQIQCSPIVIDGIMYGSTPQLKIIAVNGETGQEIWRFDPFAGATDKGALGVNRGVVFWTDGRDRRILFTAGQALYALDAATGKLIESFGAKGTVDLREGLGRDPKKQFVISNTPGIIYRDFLVLGMRVSEGPGPASPGHIRAFNVRTGKIEWVFHTIPQPGEFGYETWPPEAWKFSGGANVWTGFALDEKRGIVYCPTGSAAFDFWGGDRLGANLFANCLIALDARTGKRIWHYQFVHHDLWDRDLPAPPNLLTVRHQGKKVDAVAQVTKSGHVFLFNRQNGEPLFPIEERPVPPSTLQGESAWPTQPIPTRPAPFARQLFSEELVTDISAKSREAVLEKFRKVKKHEVFIPPSTEGSIVFPGFDGAAEWGGAGVDPKKGILYVNSNEMPWILTMVETKPKAGSAGLSSGTQIYNSVCAACHGLNREGDPARAFPTLVNVKEKLKKTDIVQLLATGKGTMPAFTFLDDQQREAVANFVLDQEEPADAARPGAASLELLVDSPYSHTGYNRFLDPDGYPAVKPPWGTFNAIDLNTGDYLWKIPFGEVPELTARGIPLTGTENYGGPVITASGVIFIAATRDEKIRAFDQQTGKVLWEAKLPAGGYATPATYSVKGRQYLVIACGGGKMGTKSGDSYVAFALPKK